MTSIGIVILSYNYVRYIAQAIDSALGQTDPFDEIVVVDDGSTDRSQDVIAQYGSRIKFIAKPNGGLLSASIAGINAITSDYIYFLDSDDYIEDCLVASIKKHLGGDVAKLHFRLRGVDERSNSIASTFPKFPQPYGRDEAIADNRSAGMYIFPPTSGNIYKRNLLAGLNLSVLGKQDSIDGSPALAMPYLGEIVSVDQPLGYYRVHGASLSQWSKPTPRLLQLEIDEFYKRWTEVCSFVGFPEPPFGTRTTPYVRERELMIAALSNEGSVAGSAARYIRSIGHSSHSAKRKALVLAWATAMLLPIASWREFLVLAFRSPVNRSWHKLIGRDRAST